MLWFLLVPFHDQIGGTYCFSSYRKVYNKRSKQWNVVPEREPKGYGYIVQLQRSILEGRIQDRHPVSRKRGLKPDDPRRISASIAAVPPPPTQELVSRHKSRFGSEKKLKTDT